MPKAFNDCVKNGGKVRTITLPNNKYRRICVLNGQVYKGEVKVAKRKSG